MNGVLIGVAPSQGVVEDGCRWVPLEQSQQQRHANHVPPVTLTDARPILKVSVVQNTDISAVSLGFTIGPLKRSP